MSDITVVIPCYTLNDEIQKLTEQSIESVGTGPLILIDNASPMGGGYLRSKATTYIRNSENLGYAKAVNQGIILAKTRYVAVTETDVRVSPNWREIASKVLKEPNTFSCHFRMTEYDVPFVYGKSIVYNGKERWCSAPFFVLDKEKELLFDEDFFNSFEDWDYFFRARQKGYNTAYTDMACFQHMHSFTQRFVQFKGTEENRKIFIQKHKIDPDRLLAQMYPDQMLINYNEGFNIEQH